MGLNLLPGAPLVPGGVTWGLFWLAFPVFCPAVVNFALADWSANRTADPARASRALWSLPRHLKLVAGGLLLWIALCVGIGPLPVLSRIDHLDGGYSYSRLSDDSDHVEYLTEHGYWAQRKAQNRALTSLPAALSLLGAVMTLGPRAWARAPARARRGPHAGNRRSLRRPRRRNPGGVTREARTSRARKAPPRKAPPRKAPD
jgi:hypothetical protein